MRFEGENAPAEPKLYDMVLVAVGRSPNGKNIGADAAGVTVSERGFIAVDEQMRTNMPHIFAIGDIVGQPMLAHKAVHEGHVAAETAAGKNSVFEARQSPQSPIRTRRSPGRVSPRSNAKRRDCATASPCFRGPHRAARLPTAAMKALPSSCSTKATIASLAAASWAPTQVTSSEKSAWRSRWGAIPSTSAKPFTRTRPCSESIGMAAEVFEGVCTDLPPQKKK